MMEATEKVGPSFRNAGNGLDLQVTSITETPDTLWYECPHVVEILLIGHVPWCQREMTTHTAFILPHRVHGGPGCAGPPPSAGKEIVHPVGQCNAGTVRERPLGTAGQKTLSAHCVEGGDFCKRLAEHVLQNSPRAVVQSLMTRVGRHRQLRASLRHFRGPWRQGRGGVPPGPKGDEGQQALAGTLRGALDKAGTTRGSCDVVCGKDVCEHGDRTVCTCSPRSLPCRG